jgi:hypothetical protein
MGRRAGERLPLDDMFVNNDGMLGSSRAAKSW